MRQELRILLASNSPADARLLETELDRTYVLYVQTVRDGESMLRALADDTPDVVIANDDPGGFSALAALEVLQESRKTLPFIIISNKPGEEAAVDAIRAGADDYVLRTDPSRLAAAIARSLGEAALRSRAQQAREQLADHQVLMHGLVSNFPGVVFQLVCDVNGTYQFSHVSDGSIELLELRPDRLESDARAFFDLLLQPDAETLEEHMQHSRENRTAVNWEGRLKAPVSGMIKWVNIRLRPRRLAAGRTAWEGFMANITRSKEHELELIASRARLSELSSHLETAKEQERGRIARELHDDIGGNLTAIKIDVLWLAERVGVEPKMRAKLAALEALVDQTAAAITRIGHDLRPGILDLGLVAAIEWQAADFSDRTGVASSVDVKCDALDLEPRIEMALFSIFRETLTNIAKHAAADHVDIELDCTEADIELTVADDGKGFVPADRLKPTSFGLRGMEERAAQLGGTVAFTTAKPRGTRVAVRVPRRRTNGHDA
jgi:signal transduction histidine kinase/CheY-like chemotaxis protein